MERFRPIRKINGISVSAGAKLRDAVLCLRHPRFGVHRKDAEIRHWIRRGVLDKARRFPIGGIVARCQMIAALVDNLPG